CRPLRAGLWTRPRYRVGGRRRHPLPTSMQGGYDIRAVRAGHAASVRPLGEGLVRGHATDEELALMSGAPLDVLRRIALFAELDDDELERVARLFKERRFSEGETIIQQGSGAAAFFVIDSGEAT